MMMKDKNKLLTITCYVLGIAIVVMLLWGLVNKNSVFKEPYDDGIEQVDLDTIYLHGSKIEVDFSEVLIGTQEETRKLIVSTQEGKVTTKLTDRLINKLDFDFLKKTQTISYTGTGYFVVDLDNLTAANVIQDKINKTVTIRIGYPYLQAIEIDPNKIIIEDVKEGLLARGDIELTVADYNAIEKDLRARLQEKFDTAANGQEAADIALKMVKEIYEPIVKAIDRRYTVIVEYK